MYWFCMHNNSSFPCCLVATYITVKYLTLDVHGGQVTFQDSFNLLLKMTLSKEKHNMCIRAILVKNWFWWKSTTDYLARVPTKRIQDYYKRPKIWLDLSSCDSEIVWLISSYVLYVWETVHVKISEVKLEKFFGYLTFKYKMHQATSSVQLINLHYI